MLRTIAGLIPIAEGELLISELPIKKYKTRDLAKIIGYVPQDTSIEFSFSAQHIVLMGRYPYLPRFGLETKKDVDIAKQAMALTDTLHLAKRNVTTLSGGQRQLIFIAKALAQQPEILLLDEPISALDIRYQLRVLELIRRLAHEGMTVVTALHDLNLAARYCDRLFLLKEGHILSYGTPDEVLTVDIIQKAYGVIAHIHTDPTTRSPVITAVSEAKKNIRPEEEW